jgi:hypothetical protein
MASVPDRTPSVQPNVARLPAPRQLAYPDPRSFPDEPRRLTLLGAALAVIFAVIVGGVVYAGSHKLPATYQATTEFLVTVPNQQGISDPTVTAENDIASQYAQLVSATPVVNAAAKALKVSASTLSGAITGTTVGAENLVQIAATAPNAAQANARAQAAGNAAVAYIQRLTVKSSESYSRSANRTLKGIDGEIAALQRKVKKDSKTQRPIDESTITQLLGEKYTETASIGNNAAAGETSLQAIPGGGNASQTAPNPKEYGLIGALAALVVALRVVYVLRVGMPRRRTARG